MAGRIRWWYADHPHYKRHADIDEYKRLSRCILGQAFGKMASKIALQKKIYDFGSYSNFEDAVRARKDAEHKIYGEFLEQFK